MDWPPSPVYPQGFGRTDSRYEVARSLPTRNKNPQAMRATDLRGEPDQITTGLCTPRIEQGAVEIQTRRHKILAHRAKLKISLKVRHGRCARHPAPGLA